MVEYKDCFVGIRLLYFYLQISCIISSFLITLSPFSDVGTVARAREGERDTNHDGIQVLVMVEDLKGATVLGGNTVGAAHFTVFGLFNFPVIIVLISSVVNFLAIAPVQYLAERIDLASSLISIIRCLAMLTRRKCPFHMLWNSRNVSWKAAQCRQISSGKLTF